MYSTYEGAKKCAWKLQSVLRELELDVTLSDCLHAMARGGGYRDWAHLSQTLKGGARRLANLNGFLERAPLAMPELAVGPTHRWVELQMSMRGERNAGNRPSAKRAPRDWFVKVYEFAFAIGVIHRSHTALLRLGSGRGMRLREEMVGKISFGPNYPRLDRATLTLTVEGTAQEIFRDIADHPNFEREFQRLVEAGIFEWTGSLQTGGTLILHPPPLELVRKHVELCRRGDNEYWHMDAMFRDQEASGLIA